jgi:predicted ATPase
MERVLCPILIGRDEELSKLEDALLSANRGEGQVVLLAGDAGMGKTRLASELGQRAARLGMTVVFGGCSEAELALTYLPFLEAVGNHLAASDLETVRERLGPVRRELAHLFPQLEPEAVPPDIESTQGRLRLFEAMLALLGIPAPGDGSATGARGPALGGCIDPGVARLPYPPAALRPDPGLRNL